jgi:molybdopterin-binding protein
MIKLKNISKKFGDFELNNITLSIDSGDYFVILGKSGAGKSVLLEIMSGLITPDTGTITIEDIDITHTKIQQRNLGLVFQNHSLFPHLTVRQNILYPLKAKRILNAVTLLKFDSLVKTLKITHLLKRKPGTLSIGEAQRTALARTLITSPKCLLLDEPLSALDPQTKAETKTLLRKINKKTDINQATPQTIIHVTHNYEEAISLATKIAVVEEGKISQIGTPEEVFRHPKTIFIANFIGIKNFYKGELKRDNNKTIFIPEIDNKGSRVKFYITNESTHSYGSLILDSSNVIISNIPNESSVRNTFKGNIIDIENVKLGIEVTVKFKGLTMSALITKDSLRILELDYGKEIYLSFKATAAKFLEG